MILRSHRSTPDAEPALRADNRAVSTDALAASEDCRPPPHFVVHLDHTAQLSGGEIALERLVASGSSSRSHVILAEDGPLRARLEIAGATVEVLPLGRRAREVSRQNAAGAGGAAVLIEMAQYSLRLSKRLRELRPDVVHTNSLKAGYYGAVAARLARLPVVWHVRDRIATDYMPSSAVRLTQFLLRQLPDLVVANSSATARTTGVNPRVVANAYRPRRSPNLRSSRSTSYVVGVVGRIAPWKGQHVVLNALVSVPGVTVRFIGEPMFGEDDEYGIALRALSARLGVADRVTWVGFTHDVEWQLSGIDVLVHSSVIPEPFGQVVVEGMAAGLAVIATDAGGPAEIITANVDGLLTAPGDSLALADAMNSLREPAYRARLGDAAMRRARDFAPEQIAFEMASAWDDAIANCAQRRYKVRQANGGGSC